MMSLIIFKIMICLIISSTLSLLVELLIFPLLDLVFEIKGIIVIGIIIFIISFVTIVSGVFAGIL